MSVLVVVAATRAEAAYVPDGLELLVTAVAALHAGWRYARTPTG